MIKQKDNNNSIKKTLYKTADELSKNQIQTLTKSRDMLLPIFICRQMRVK